MGLWLTFVRLANRRTKNLRTLRRVATWVYSTMVRANIVLPGPRVLLNGPGKAGTHLLSDCLSLMPKMMFSGRHFSLADFIVHPDKPWDSQFYRSKPHPAIDRQRLERFLRACPRGMFVTTHARFHTTLQEVVEGLQFRHIILLRDPRDIVVSYTRFVMREPWHHHHRYYTETLKDDGTRLMTTICGFERCETADRPLATVRERLEGFIPWLEASSSRLICWFEDLIGPLGGGNDEKQLAEIRRIGDFVERPLTYEQAQQIAQNMYSKASLTYRKGIIGDWKNHFTEAHRCAFKEVAGDILIRLGYEENSDW
jgi:hypothetical protein